MLTSVGIYKTQNISLKEEIIDKLVIECQQLKNDLIFSCYVRKVKML